MNLQKKTKDETKRDLLISQALERHKLGLSPSEYAALTPLELSCELEAVDILEKQKLLQMKIIDEHLARLEFINNGYCFPNLKRVADFRILTRDLEDSETQKKRSETETAYLIKDKQRADAYIKNETKFELNAKRRGYNCRLFKM